MTSQTGPDLDGVVDHAQDATRRLLQTVDGMSDDDWTGASALPGWSRAHVVAHLALNAEALAAVVEGLIRGEPVPMYRSDAGRDDDIAALASAEPGVQRERLLAATTVWRDAIAALPAEALPASVERTPGGVRFPAADLAAMRWREVEIHHADLDLAYGPPHWPAAFVDVMLPLLAWDRGAEHDLRLRTPDAEIAVGAGTGQVIGGSPAALAWWLLGRGTGEGLSGELPALGPWTRRPPQR